MESWDEWQSALAAHLRTLDDGGFLNTMGPEVEVEGRGLVGRLQGPRPWAPGVYVLRLDDHLVVDTCVPSRHEPDWLDAARERLRGAGWAPQPEHVTDTDRLVRYVPLEQPEAVAALAALAYPVLGVPTPDLVEVEVVRTPLTARSVSEHLGDGRPRDGAQGDWPVPELGPARLPDPFALGRGQRGAVRTGRADAEGERLPPRGEVVGDDLARELGGAHPVQPRAGEQLDQVLDPSAGEVALVRDVAQHPRAPPVRAHRGASARVVPAAQRDPSTGSG